jgi:peptidoglycan/LPS O-acetylase OafA/YrhL
VLGRPDGRRHRPAGCGRRRGAAPAAATPAAIPAAKQTSSDAWRFTLRDGVLGAGDAAVAAFAPRARKQVIVYIGVGTVVIVVLVVVVVMFMRRR